VEVILGGLSSLLYGVADFLGGEGAKRAPAASIVLWSGLLSFPLIVGFALVLGGEASSSDLLWGGLAGASGAIGLVLLFAGLGSARAAAVAPVSAVVGTILPVFIAVVDGERPSRLAWVGVAVAIPAIVLCAWAPEKGTTPFGGSLYGVGAGLGFGGFTALIRNTSDGSGLMPLITVRGATVLVVLILAALGMWRVSRFSAVPKRIVGANAVLDVSGNVAILLAIRAGSLALAAVAASFYPAVTVMMARLVNGESLLRTQGIGIVLTMLALATIALG
jgi:drug/metabolite transporter (DMT)-like permease